MFDHVAIWLENHEAIASGLLILIIVLVAFGIAVRMARAEVIPDEHATRFADRNG